MKNEIDIKKIEEGMHEMMKDKINQLEKVAEEQTSREMSEKQKSSAKDVIEERIGVIYTKAQNIAKDYIDTSEYNAEVKELMNKYMEKLE